METYNKLKPLGQGTFGTVYLYERKHNKQKFVVKKINSDLDSNQILAAKNEVAILKALKHPNIIQYHDSFTKTGVFYIVMEYARHGSLYDYINKQKPHNFLSIEKILNIFCQILMGLEHIHSKRIIHRDLKCENIFLTGIKSEVIKIGDFGISKALLNNNNKANTVIGTTNYIAPEICDGQPYDTKTDIWSLGCILYELCALQRLFEGSVGNIVFSIKSGKRKMINIDQYGQDFQRLIDYAIQTNPADRPTATAYLADSYVFPVRHVLMLDLGNIV